MWCEHLSLHADGARLRIIIIVTVRAVWGSTAVLLVHPRLWGSKAMLLFLRALLVNLPTDSVCRFDE